ncbi:hypothetical protein JCM15519_17500 [Fundidesulfovibrio butyratiphilus]
MSLTPFRLAVAALALALAGCANQKIPDENVTQANLYADVNALKSRTQELRRSVEALEARTGGKNADVSLEDVNARLTRLESVVTRLAQALSLDVGQSALGPGAPAGPGTTNEAPARSDVSQSAMTAAGSEPASPAGSYAPQGQSERGDEYAPDTAETRRPADDASQAVETAARTAATPAEGIYNLAMEAYNARDYAKAAGLFAEMLRAYPGDRLAPSALFWQADSFYQQGDYARTALLCQDVIQKYPGHSLAASAMLKQAQAFRRLGRDQAARIVLQEVVKRYPGSAEARSAQAQLGGTR